MPPKPQKHASIFEKYKTLSGEVRLNFFRAHKDAIWSAFHAERASACANA